MENKVVTLCLANGAEIIGKFISSNENYYTIERPRLVQVNDSGVGLLDGVAMTPAKVDGTLDFNKSCVVFVAETMPEIANGWLTQTSGIQTTQKSILLS